MLGVRELSRACQALVVIVTNGLYSPEDLPAEEGACIYYKPISRCCFTQVSGFPGCSHRVLEYFILTYVLS
ncbi:hypothetical protein NXS19_010380 [Fusarium pseudograminearum]|nr:hypothetical protein NXS19_010380 [Fusarium pseudograminearum]